MTAAGGPAGRSSRSTQAAWLTISSPAYITTWPTSGKLSKSVSIGFGAQAGYLPALRRLQADGWQVDDFQKVLSISYLYRSRTNSVTSAPAARKETTGWAGRVLI